LCRYPIFCTRWHFMAGTLYTAGAETAIHAQGPATLVTPCANSGGTLYNCGRDLGAKVAGAGASETGFPAGVNAAGMGGPELHFVIDIGVQEETLAVCVPAVNAHDEVVAVAAHALRS